MAYKLEFADSVNPEDMQFDSHGVKVIVDPKSLPYLLGTVQVGQALRIDDDLHAVAIELHVLGVHAVGELELIGHAGAAGRAHADAQAHALAALREVGLDVLRRVFSERDHATFFSSTSFG